MSLRLVSTFTPIFLALEQKTDFPLHLHANCILMNCTNLSKSNITVILDVIWLRAIISLHLEPLEYGVSWPESGEKIDYITPLWVLTWTPVQLLWPELVDRYCGQHLSPKLTPALAGWLGGFTLCCFFWIYRVVLKVVVLKTVCSDGMECSTEPEWWWSDCVVIVTRSVS